MAALGDERQNGGDSLIVKAWDTSGLGSGVVPVLLVSTRITSKLPEMASDGFGVASISLSEGPFVRVAFGTAAGVVHVYQGTLNDTKATKLMPLFQPSGYLMGQPRSMQELKDAEPLHEITALHFVEAMPPDLNGPRTPHLFAVSRSALVALDLKTGQSMYEDDGCGAEKHCSAILESNGELLLAKDDAVYFFTAEEGRKTAAAIRGKKHAVARCGKKYVAIVTAEDVTGSASQVKHAKIFDPLKKIFAACVPLKTPFSIAWLLTLPERNANSNVVIVAGSGGEVLSLLEKKLEERLSVLTHARAFQAAITLGQEDGASPQVMADIHRRYGDFLYSKRDYEAAVKEYELTVGHLFPSYVIQRFLDAQRLHNLTSYLETLHKSIGTNGVVVSADHTALLLNCYTKLRAVEKINDFVKQASAGSLQICEAGAAISVLEKGGFLEQAQELAYATKETDAYLRILLEGLHQPEEALKYIRTELDRKAAATALKRYGVLLLQGDAVGMTALLMELCLPQSDLHSQDSECEFVADISEYAHLYRDRPEDLRYACVTILAMSPAGGKSRQTLYHTLLDLYLSNTSDGDLGQAEAHEAMDLLQQGWQAGEEPAYDVDRTLTMCKIHSFDDGLVFLYTNLRMYREAAAVLASYRRWDRLLELCEQYGTAATGGDPGVWLEALTRLSSPAAGPQSEPALRELLNRIEANGVMQPLTVLPILAQNPHLCLDLVKDYVVRALEAENRAIVADLEEIERLKVDVEKNEAEIKRVTSEPIVFQATKDALTGAPLELPSIHFLCGHSFNVRTLGDEESECPVCGPEHQRVKELAASYQTSAEDADAFFRELRSTPDGFTLIAEFFGKGLLNNTSSTVE